MSDTANPDTTSLAGRRVLVTGANGFVGRSVCRWFLDRGADVVGCVRRPDARLLLPTGTGCEVVADPLERRAWQQVVDDRTTVVHLIARTHVANEGPDALPEYQRTNVEVTRALLVAAVDAGVPRFVFASSVKAVGEGEGSPYSPTSPCRPCDAYGRTKLEAERLVQSECDGTATTQTIVRPPLVYGAGVRGNFERLVRAVDRGLPLPLGLAHARRSLVHVRNLADAIGTIAFHPAAAGRVLHVADEGAAPTVRELVETVARHLGRPARLVPVPTSLLRAVGQLLGRSGAVERLTGSLVLGTRELRELLAWRAPVSFDEGVRDTVEGHRRTTERRGAAA